MVHFSVPCLVPFWSSFWTHVKKCKKWSPFLELIFRGPWSPLGASLEPSWASQGPLDLILKRLEAVPGLQGKARTGEKNSKRTSKEPRGVLVGPSSSKASWPSFLLSWLSPGVLELPPTLHPGPRAPALVGGQSPTRTTLGPLWSLPESLVELPGTSWSCPYGASWSFLELGLI